MTRAEEFRRALDELEDASDQVEQTARYSDGADHKFAQTCYANARAEVERLFAESERDAALGRAINRAAAELPESYDIEIALSKDSGSMSMYDPNGFHVYFPTNHESMTDEINDAIDAALAASKEGT